MSSETNYNTLLSKITPFNVWQESGETVQTSGDESLQNRLNDYFQQIYSWTKTENPPTVTLNQGKVSIRKADLAEFQKIEMQASRILLSVISGPKSEWEIKEGYFQTNGNEQLFYRIKTFFNDFRDLTGDESFEDQTSFSNGTIRIPIDTLKETYVLTTEVSAINFLSRITPKLDWYQKRDKDSFFAKGNASSKSDLDLYFLKIAQMSSKEFFPKVNLSNDGELSISIKDVEKFRILESQVFKGFKRYLSIISGVKGWQIHLDHFQNEGDEDLFKKLNSYFERLLKLSKSTVQDQVISKFNEKMVLSNGIIYIPINKVFAASVLARSLESQEHELLKNYIQQEKLLEFINELLGDDLQWNFTQDGFMTPGRNLDNLEQSEILAILEQQFELASTHSGSTIEAPKTLKLPINKMLLLMKIKKAKAPLLEAERKAQNEKFEKLATSVTAQFNAKISKQTLSDEALSKLFAGLDKNISDLWKEIREKSSTVGQALKEFQSRPFLFNYLLGKYSDIHFGFIPEIGKFRFGFTNPDGEREADELTFAEIEDTFQSLMDNLENLLPNQ